MRRFLLASVILLGACEHQRSSTAVPSETGCKLPRFEIGVGEAIPAGLAASLGGSERSGDGTTLSKSMLKARAIPESAAREVFLKRISDRFMELSDGQGSGEAVPDREFRALLLSTGGPWGTFGASFLQTDFRLSYDQLAGLPADPDRPDAERTRGDILGKLNYDLVTGASTGSVIAPFAFLGTAADYQAALDIYVKELAVDPPIQQRNLLDTLSRGSIYDTGKMRKLMKDKVSQLRVIERLGKASVGSRTLAVVAVNVDTGLSEIFDLTAIAQGPGDLAARQDAFVERIMASVAIPIAFDPVFIDGCMYQDAGLRQQLFMGAETIAAYARRMNPESVPGLRMGRFGPEWVIDLDKARRQTEQFDANGKPLPSAPIMDMRMIVNGSPNALPDIASDRSVPLARMGLFPLIGRDLALLVDQSMWASIDRAALVARRLNWDEKYRDAHAFKPWYEAQCNVEGPPADADLCKLGKTFDPKSGFEGEIFVPAHINALVKYGKLLGSEADPSKRWEPIPGSPDIYSVDN